MLKTQLLHPEILEQLARSGHGSKILIADGNFPFQTKPHPSARRVFLNLTPGTLGCVEVLKALCSAIVVESALVMAPPAQGEYAVEKPAIWEEFEQVLRESGNPSFLGSVGRFNFYDACASPDLSLVIATGEQKIFANLMLTVGVVRGVN